MLFDFDYSKQTLMFCSLSPLSSASFLATAAVFRQRDEISDWPVNVMEHLAVKAETL